MFLQKIIFIVYKLCSLALGRDIREVPLTQMRYDLKSIAQAMDEKTKLIFIANPNNPTGVVYSAHEVQEIASLADEFGAVVIADQLYSRLRYDDATYTHLRTVTKRPENVVTIMGPSKTESLSGYRLGVAFGGSKIIERMEKLQAIVSLRAAGYNQAVLRTWFNEPDGWMAERVRLHQAIRDDLISVFQSGGMETRVPQAGSYLFPQLPPLSVDFQDFVKLLRHQANVIVTPGTEFSPHSAASIRLNFSQDHSAAVGAAHRIVEMVNRYQ